jgi:hypothetical protein
MSPPIVADTDTNATFALILQIVFEPVVSMSQLLPLTLNWVPEGPISATAVPGVNCALQVLPQFIPAGDVVIVPDPDLLTITVLTSVNCAVTALLLLIVSVQLVLCPALAQSPPQPANSLPELGCAVSVTAVLAVWVAPHVVPQSMPPPVTEPSVRLKLLTWSWNVPGVNVAVTVFAAFMLTVQVLPELLVHPLQLWSDEPAEAVAVNTTLLSRSKSALQVEPQFIPAGDEVTVPVPAPAFVIVSCVGTMNEAVTDLLVLIGIVQLPVPEQAPPQPTNVNPAPAFALRVAVPPQLYVALQVVPQLILLSVVVTELAPAPEPVFVTVRTVFVSMKLAYTVLSDSIPTVQLVPVLEHPLQLPNL